MVIALSPNLAREVVVESDAGATRPTVFMVKPPTHGWVEAKPLSERKPSEIVATHLTGWRDLYDARGLEVAWPGSSDQAVAHLPLSVIGELATSILRMTFLDTETKGK